MKKIILILIAGLLLQQSNAQIPDDTNGWLYRLCKTWGYVKYFNQNKCDVAWDELLNNTINEVLMATSNAEFNNSLLKFLNQAGNNVAVTNSPAMPDTNLLVNTDWINDPLFSKEVNDFLVSFPSHVYPDKSTCFVRISDYAHYPDNGWIDFTQDLFSLAIDYTIESHRLTVMFYYWNLINYFFPYRNLMDTHWDTTLQEFIPIFRQSLTEPDFHKNFLKLVTRINDSHGFTGSTVLSTYFWKGPFWPKVKFDRIENQCVVTKVGSMIGITPGDILTELNGIAIGEIKDSLVNFIPASTEAALYRDIYSFMLRGELNSEVNLTLTDKNGEPYSKSVKRTDDGTTWYAWHRDPGLPGSYMKTACGYGYVNMKNLQRDEISQMYNALRSAPVIIFDIRNYPNINLQDLLPSFFSSPYNNAVIHEPALFNGIVEDGHYYYPGWYYLLNGKNSLGQWSNPSPYTGKIYILVNQETQSAAEYTCQALSYHPGSKVIGTQTAGADGNIARIIIPGGIHTTFTALGTYYADGYQQQRNGVKIDKIVEPTIQGIRDGVDEILLAALDCISGLDHPALNPFEISVYPNPVTSGQVRIGFTLEKNSKVTISLFDITGRIIAEENRFCLVGEQTVDFDLNQVASGSYNLKIRCNGNSSLKKLIIR